MTIMQEPVYDIMQAFNDNMFGGVLFLFFLGLGGMFIIFALVPSLRNAKIMGVVFFILIAASFVAAYFVWPEAREAFFADPQTTIGAGIVALLVSPVFIYLILILAIGLILNVLAGRGLLGRGRE